MWRTSTRAPCSTSLSAAKVRPAAAARWSGVSPTSSVASTSVRSSSSSTDSASTAPTVQGDAHTCEQQAWSRPTRSRSRPAWSAVACGLWPRANPVGPGFEPCVAYCQRSGGVACSCRHRACSGPHPRRVRHAARARPPAPPPRGCCSRQRRRGGAATLVKGCTAKLAVVAGELARGVRHTPQEARRHKQSTPRAGEGLPAGRGSTANMRKLAACELASGVAYSPTRDGCGRLHNGTSDQKLDT